MEALRILNMCYDRAKEVKSKSKLTSLYPFYIGYVLSVIYKMHTPDSPKEPDAHGRGGRETGSEEKSFETRVLHSC